MKTTFRSFTIRVPIGLYIEIGEAAQTDKVAMNQKINELIKLGLGRHVSLDQALRRLLTDEIIKQAGEQPDVCQTATA